jgi:hypothetical protein
LGEQPEVGGATEAASPPDDKDAAEAPSGHLETELPADPVLIPPQDTRVGADGPGLVIQEANVAGSGPPFPPVIEVHDLDWAALARSIEPSSIRARLPMIVEGMEKLVGKPVAPPLLFSSGADLAIRIDEERDFKHLWFIGDLHGDWLALEAAMALIQRESADAAEVVFLGDLFDDGAFGLETVLRVFEIVLQRPGAVCILVGNHDEALSYNGERFASATVPGDFADCLNSQSADEWIRRVGQAAIGLFAKAPRALFFPDGLLAAHGGVPLVDLHEGLKVTRNWNDPGCLADFVWTRAHPTARRKLPNRFSRGSQFGYEDFSNFCALATELGRPVTHMIRGHDHVEERFAVYPAYARNPILTTVALSRRLMRESFGPPVRVPTIARYVQGSLPQVHRLHIPEAIVEELYAPELSGAGEADSANSERA